MKRHFRILAGAIVGLVLAAAPLAALPLPDGFVDEPARMLDALSRAGPVILAQAQSGSPEQEELLRKLKRKKGERAAPRAPKATEAPAPRKQLERAKRPPEARAPAAEKRAPAKAEKRAPKPRAREAARQPPKVTAPAAANERLQKRQQRKAVTRPAEPKAPVTAAKPKPKPKAREAVKPRTVEPEAAAAAEDRLKKRKQQKAVTRPAEPKAPVTAAKPKPKPGTREAVKPRTVEPEAAATAEERLKKRKQKAAMRPAEPGAPTTAETPKRPPATAPRGGDQPMTAKKSAARPPVDKKAEGKQGLREDAARVLDSDKEQPAKRKPGRIQVDRPAPVKAVRPPESDAAAQRQIRAKPTQIRSVISEEGRRIKRPRRVRPEVPAGADLVREVNNRFIFRTSNNYFIERPREERIIVNAREVYYEELPRSRQREVVIRQDGTRIITICNRWGDVVRRVKVFPDGREIVLVYVDDDYYDEVMEWHDPGIYLPPLSLAIPVRDYILDAEWVEDPDDYYTFLEQPPVEQVERTYSLAEVRRSARIRDKVRRIDLDIINFEFGSAQIPESEIGKLEGVAEAMQRLLKENPGETFLIEGHTDAVGSEVANLALSDQRAEAVATALTNVFDIPPENMETQGYGEQYLKIDTQEPERENRRVAIRRITPLVAPVASAE